MTRLTIGGALLLLSVVLTLAVSGCAGTGGQNVPDNPKLITDEIADIELEILNVEEMYKSRLTQLQMEENTDLRREVNSLWTELEYLRSRKTALEMKLRELESEDGN